MIDNAFKVKNKYLSKKIEKVFSEYWDNLKEQQLEILKIVVIRFKKYSNNEDFLYFIILYSLFYFGHISIDSVYLTDTHRSYIYSIIDSLKAEMRGDVDAFLEKMLEMDEDLFLMKIIVKSVIVNEPEKFWWIIPDMQKYFKTIWWIIPLLSYKEYPKILNNMQDKYFEHVYNEEYNRTKRVYRENIAEIDVVENFMVDVINDLNRIMENLSVFWRITVRRKSYFSIYNKIKRKTDKKINDFIGVRTVFKTEAEIKKFSKMFEDKFIIETKKDYITTPKKSWYKAIHYIFIYYYWNVTKKLELQMRTARMNRLAHTWNLCHFIYSINENKWDPLFKEIHEWLNWIKNFNIEPWNKYFWHYR